MVSTRASKRKLEEQMDPVDPEEDAMPLPSPPYAASDMAAPSTTAAAAAAATTTATAAPPPPPTPATTTTTTTITTDQHQGEVVDTSIESTPPDKPEVTFNILAGNASHADTERDPMPPIRRLEAEFDQFYLSRLHVVLAGEITVMANHRFRPTPWKRLKPDDQTKLKRWTPHAKLLIESESGFSLIFQAWIWHILDDGVFSADVGTKWEECGEGYEAVKLLSQFLDVIQNQFFSFLFLPYSLVSFFFLSLHTIPILSRREGSCPL